jgi:FkbM family methyltransferase
MIFKNQKSLPFRLLRRIAFFLGMRLEIETDFQPLTIESMILSQVGNRSEVNFLQIGANDANNNNDPLRVLRQTGEWRGWMIEPNPPVFKRLTKSVSYFPKIQCINYAVSETDGILPFYYIKNPHTTKHPFVADQLSSLSRSHVRQELISWGYDESQAEGAIASVEVTCKSPTSLVAELAIKHLDLLLVDAEGHDFQIIKHFPFNQLRPDIFVFETKHLKKSERDQIPELMSEYGYSFWEIGEDVIAKSWK